MQQLLAALLHRQLQFVDVRLQLLGRVHVELHQLLMKLIQQAVLQQFLHTNKPVISLQLLLPPTSIDLLQPPKLLGSSLLPLLRTHAAARHFTGERKLHATRCTFMVIHSGVAVLVQQFLHAAQCDCGEVTWVLQLEEALQLTTTFRSNWLFRSHRSGSRFGMSLPICVSLRAAPLLRAVTDLKSSRGESNSAPGAAQPARIPRFSLSAILLLEADRVKPQLVMWDTCTCCKDVMTLQLSRVAADYGGEDEVLRIPGD
ncbi:hypothetical protein EYF80_029485 [Liparis tanakae]|uniref:Uncharacterized protein n=1 Tax=Liparis tanakae TaxID=230148 RepID=A0A4Z2H4E0_9TELE|nr:hypothetical protein EYF80_029485 [Liparis tanakae]